MNMGNIQTMLDQLRRNLTPSKQLIFTITNAGVVTIHKQYGWQNAMDSSDIVLAGGTVTVTSQGAEFTADGLFVSVNTNAPYAWVSASSLTITAIFGIAGKMSVKITGEL